MQIGDNPGSIELRSPLTIANGQNFSLVGGEINLTGSNVNTDENGFNSAADGIIAPGGRVELGGLSSAGIVNFDNNSNLVFPENVSKADINLDNYFINASAGGDGSIALQSRNFGLTNSFLITGINSNVESTDTQAGDITIDTDEATIIEATDSNQSLIFNTTGLNITGDLSEPLQSDDDVEAVNNTGNAGNILINTDTLSMTGAGQSFIISETNSEGNAGNILINTDTLSMTGAGQSVIISETNSEGNAGNIDINARSSVSLNSSELFFTQVSSSVRRLGSGNGADVNIDTQSLSLKNAIISTTTIGAGDAGNISIDATDSVTANSSSIEAATLSSGNAGNIIFESNTADLTFREQTFVGTPIFFRIDGEIFDLPDLSFVGTGKGGDVTINGRSLVMTEGVAISTFTGGEVISNGLVDAGDIELDISDSIVVSDGSVLSTNTIGEGNAGNLTINTMNLKLSEGARILANTEGIGDGGNITIEANEIQLTDNSTENIGTDISATSTNSGNGGTVNITADNLKIVDSAGISVRSSGSGNAGEIFAQIRNSFEIENGEISSRSDRSSGGEIEILAGDIRLRGNSNIQTSVENGAGGGGNITLGADSIVAFDDSDIFASSADGRGGNITLDTDAFFANNFSSAFIRSNPQFIDSNSRVDINASGSVAGIVDVPDVNFLPNDLVELSEDTIDSNEVVANSCVVRNGQQGGTLIVTGSEGIPVRPGDAAVSDYSTGAVRSIPDKQDELIESAKDRQPGAITEPEGAYRLSDGRLVLSRECG